jgi:hypothetical protein
MVELFHVKGSLGLGGSARSCWLALRRAPPTLSGKTDLVAGLEEVLTSEDILWGKLTEVLLGSHLTGEEGRGEAGASLHLALRRGHLTGTHGGARGHLRGTTGSVHALVNRVGGLLAHGSGGLAEHVDHDHHGESNENLARGNLLEHLHLYILWILFFYSSNM